MSKDSKATRPDAASSGAGGHTLTKLGVRVRKSLTKNGGDVPTIRYDVTSGRDEPVVAHLIDVLPADIPEEAIGFHPDYGKEHWESANGRVEYRRRLEPGETIVTVCGVRLPEEMSEQVLLDEPILRVETPDMLDSEGSESAESDGPVEPEYGSGAASADTGRPTSDGGSTRGKAPTRDHATSTETTYGSTTAGAARENGPSHSPTHGERSSAHGGYQSTPRDGSVAAALAADIREGRISEADRETLQDALDFGPDLVNDVVVDRLREVIQQERTNLEAEVETLEKSLYQLSERTTTNEQSIETIKKILKKLNSGKADVEALEALRSELEALESEAMSETDLEQLRGVLTELKDAKTEAERLAEVETDLARLHSAIPNEERLDRIEDSLAELRSASATKSKLDDLRAELRSLERETVTTADLAELADRSADKSELDRVKSAIEELEERIVDADEIEGMLDDDGGDLGGSTDVSAVRKELKDLRETVEEVDEFAAKRESVEELYDYVSDLETGVDRDGVIEMMESLHESMPSSEQLDRLERRIDDLESETVTAARVRRLERQVNGQSTPTTDGGTVAQTQHGASARMARSDRTHSEESGATQRQAAAEEGIATNSADATGSSGVAGPTTATGSIAAAADGSALDLTGLGSLMLIGGVLMTAIGLFFGAARGDVQLGFLGFAAGASLLTAWALHGND